MKLSFGMIFSIILIVVFLAFAIYAIMKFLDIQKGVQVGQFSNDLQTDIDKMWKGSQGSIEQTYRIPSGVDYVCLADFNSPKKGINMDKYSDLRKVFYEFENLVFYPIGSGAGLDSIVVRHINLSNTVSSENPLCFPNEDGKVKMIIKMNPGDTLVTVSK